MHIFTFCYILKLNSKYSQFVNDMCNVMFTLSHSDNAHQFTQNFIKEKKKERVESKDCVIAQPKVVLSKIFIASQSLNKFGNTSIARRLTQLLKKSIMLIC